MNLKMMSAMCVQFYPSLIGLLVSSWMIQGWELLSQFPPFRYFPKFSASWIHALSIECHVYIWHVSPQLSCGDTCQIWMWLEEFSRYFRKIENYTYGEINERSLSNPHPWPSHPYMIMSDYWRNEILIVLFLSQMLDQLQKLWSMINSWA